MYQEGVILSYNPNVPNPAELALFPSASDRLLKEIAKARAVQGIGFWATSDDPRKDDYGGEFPWPGDYIDPSWDETQRVAVVNFLRSRPFTARFMGHAKCRLCGLNVGSGDQSDGVYVWPEGLAHYVEKHSLRPPQPFIEHVMGTRK